MPDPLKPNEIAKFAAEGVAIALKARDASYRGTLHIICGDPKVIYNVEIVADQQGNLHPGKIEEKK